jgi:ABC-type branched-subunit amino acid transport system ATPase component
MIGRRQSQQHHCSVCAEDRRIFTELTVMENLAVGRRPKRAELPEWTPGRFDDGTEMTGLKSRSAAARRR